ncbi:MAG: hypothetical protein ACE1Y8_01355 [Acidimicrobiia bacterium]|nr:organomercurial lyase [Actinomycetota bacterium]MCZ6739856.1 organomercurial lyase [Actinomycetota bacterium]
MTAFDRQVRAQIYRLFSEGMTVVDGAAMTESRGWVAKEVEASLDRLAEAHLIKLAEGSHRVEMAHPFSGTHTGYRSVVGDRSWNANCAWDALALLALMGDGEAFAPGADGDLVWTVDDGNVSPDGVVHLLIPASRFWDDIGFT